MNRTVTWERGAPSLGEAVTAIGVFDGVHVGHQALLAGASSDARARDLSCVAVTFDRDPDQVVTPEAPAPQLLTLSDKCEFLLSAGADRVLVVPFDATLAALAPEHFLEDVLLLALDPAAIHVGVDFRFGRYAEGDVSVLVDQGARRGFEVHAHELVTHDGSPVTSTRVRRLVEDGDVEAAAVLLGRLHRVSGRVVRGRGVGARNLGVPTANLLPVEHAALPADGVYAGWAAVEGTRYPAAISVGIPPTFPTAHSFLEAHLLDVDRDLYGRIITVEFATLIRVQRWFGEQEELATAIARDIEATRTLLTRDQL